MQFRARVARQIFPYKPFPNTKRLQRSAEAVKVEVPPDGNTEVEDPKWTLVEQRAMDDALRGWARWSVDFGSRFVKATGCSGTTTNKSGVCDACETLAKDKTFKKAVYRVSELCCRKEPRVPY